MTRRTFAALLGGSLGTATTSECMTPEELEQLGGKLEQASNPLIGSASVRWCDTYAELQTLAGGTTQGATNVAVVRGSDTAALPGPSLRGGGLFVWHPTPATSDGGTLFPDSAGTGSWARLYEGPLNVRWFGARGDGVTDDTQAIQAAINAASHSMARVVYFPAGKYNFTQLRCYYDATLNPGYLANRHGELTLLGEGISPENGGTAGTVLKCTSTSGNGLVVASQAAGHNARPYPARDFVARGISFEGGTSGFLVEVAGCPGFEISDCKFIQTNPAGSALYAMSIWFGTLSRVRFVNSGAGTKTGDAIRFGSGEFAGEFTLEQLFVTGYGYGLNHETGPWQLMSIRDSEITGSINAIRINSGMDVLNLYGCYFENGGTSYIADTGHNKLRCLQLNGCWFYSKDLTGPAINLSAPNTVVITGCSAQDQNTTFLHINEVPSGGGGSYVVTGMRFPRPGETPAPVTLFTGVVPQLFGVDYLQFGAPVTLFPPTTRPVQASAMYSYTSQITAGRLNISHIKKYPPRSADQDIYHNAQGRHGAVDITATGVLTFLLTDGWLANLTHGFSVYVKNNMTSTASINVRPQSGSTVIATLAPGQAQWFFFDREGSGEWI